MVHVRVATLTAAALVLLSACGTTTTTTTATMAETSAAASSVEPEASATETATPGPASVASSPDADTDDQSELPEVAPDSLVPAVDVVDVRSGATVNLGSIVPSDKPVLLWAWAPHCPSCRAEAGDLEKFAASHQDRLTVVGIGTQDDLDYARGFLEDTGVTTPLMLWDESFESWRTIGITAQPTWILVRGDGSFIDGWIGALPEDRILELLDA